MHNDIKARRQKKLNPLSPLKLYISITESVEILFSPVNIFYRLPKICILNENLLNSIILTFFKYLVNSAA